MTLSSEFPKKPPLPVSCHIWIIVFLLMFFGTQVLSTVVNDGVPEESRSLNLDDTSERRDTLQDSARIRTRNNSPALNHFLEDVLNAQDELKWIDRAVHRSGNPQNIEPSFPRRKSRDRVRGHYHDDEIKAKREIDDKIPTDMSESLSSLKRTIIELSDSLKPHESVERRVINEKTTKLDGKRKLLSSPDIRSAMDIAIEYYDYEDDADPAVAMVNSPIERENKHEDAPISSAISSSKPEITKKDENTEEEEKEEQILQKLPNKVPKEEFLSDVQESSAVKESPSLYNSLVLKRIAEDSDSSDFYNQCEIGTSGDSKIFVNNENTVLKNDEPEIFKERTYLVVSPSFVKRQKKRSVKNFEDDDDVQVTSGLNSSADKSARNYAALKITDDMFKGGMEQSNSHVEDKPLVDSTSFSSHVFSSTIDSTVSSRFFNVRTTSPEWKFIEVAKKKEPMPRHYLQSERVFGRHLTQIVQEISVEHANTSSITMPTTSNDHETALTKQSTKSSDEIFANASTVQRENVRNEEKENIEFRKPENSTIDEKFRISPDTKKIIVSNVTNIRNNTRLRRNAETFDNENIRKHRKHRAHRRVKNHENTTGSKRQSSLDAETQRRKLTVLLAADNVEDESQIDLALHGELAGKIVERIFEQVQRNEGLKVALGPGLYRKHKPQESMALDKMYRQGLDENEVKETEAMMRRVMELLGRLVLDEVRRKTCVSLAPDMRDFLQWSLGLEEPAGSLSDQVPPLPLIPGHDQQSTQKSPSPYDKFLFPNSTGDSSGFSDLTELERKVNLLKSLINEYHALSEREKTKVQTVHDYLVRQLSMLVRYIEEKEAAEREQVSKNNGISGAKLGAPQQILQYQAYVTDSSIGRISQNTTNASNVAGAYRNHRQDYSMFNAGPMSGIYLNDNSRVAKKHAPLHTEREKRTDVVINDNANDNDNDDDDTNKSLEYRKLLRQISTLRRKKREYTSDYYEIPKIYHNPDDKNFFIYRNMTVQSVANFSSSHENSSFPIVKKNSTYEKIFYDRDTRKNLIFPENKDLTKIAEKREKSANNEKKSIEDLINVFPVENIRVT